MRQKSLLQSLTLRALLLVTLLVGSFGTAWADDAYYTLDTSVEANETTSNGYASNGTVTVDGIGWTFNGNGQMHPWRIGGKSLKSVDRIAYTTTPMDVAISKVDLTVGTASGITVNSLTLIVASDASFNTVIDEVSQPFEASSTISFTPESVDSWSANAYYKFVFKVTVSVTSNKFVQFSKVEFYKASAAVSVESVSLNKNSTSLVVGGTETLTATITPDNATDKSVTWSSDNTDVATVSNGVVTAVAAGDATITVTTEQGGKTATCLVTVTSGAVAVTGVSLNKNSTTLLVGATETLTATVAPNDATNKNVTWESDDVDIATVDENGEISAVGVGTANITVTTEDGDFTATCAVTVNPVAVESVSLNKTETSITVGATETLTATIAPNNATNKNVTWTSSDESVATVDGGVVTGVAVGTATITVTTTDGSKTATCEVTVAAAPAEETITFSELGYANAADLTTVNGTSVTLTFAEGTNGTNSPKYYTTGTGARMYNGNTLTIESATKTITSIEFTFSGSYTTLTLPDGQPGSLSEASESKRTWTGSAKSVTFSTTATNRIQSVKVSYAPEGPAVNVSGVSLKESTTLYVGSTETLTATITPDNATNKNVTWASDDEDIATVDEDGKVTAVAVGTATITVTTVDGEKTATCEVTVVPVPVESVSLNKTATVLGIGDTETLTATVSPDNAANKNVTWSSNDTDVATVSNGVVTAVAAGEATITVTTEDGGKTATCVVTVTAPVAVTGVSLDETELNLFVGDTETLTATIAPAEATNKNVIWTSSDEAVATVDGGVVTAVAVGTATITVTTVDGGKTATCEVTVTAAPGTLANPYTVEQARAAIDAGAGLENVYATGIVSEIVSPYNSTYGNISYNISADGTTEADQLQAYRGKSYNGDNFESEDDIQVGDVVVIFGTLKKYNSTYEFGQDNQLVSLQRKEASLAKVGDIALDFKNENLMVDIHDYIETESTGALTYSGYDATIVDVDEDGMVMGLKEGTTTITVQQAEDATYGAGAVDIEVTVADTREAATTIPAINISSVTVGNAGTLSVDGPVKADDGVTFTFASSDEAVLLIVGDEYEASAVGNVTVTVTATASNSLLYKNVVAEFPVEVRNAVLADNEIDLSSESGSTPYGTPLEVLYEAGEGSYDGEVIAESANTAIATVALSEGTATITPVAVGTTTITFSAPATPNYKAADNVVFTVEVTMPEGGETVPGGVVTPVTTTFTDKNLNYEDGGMEWTASIAGNSFEARGVQFGAAKGKFTLTADAGNVTKVSMVVSTNANDGVNSIAVSVGGNAFTVDGDGETTTFSMPKGNDQTVEFIGTGSDEVVISVNDANKSVYFKSITVWTDGVAAVEMVTLNASGYATYCSVNPLQLTSENFTAWRVASIDEDAEDDSHYVVAFEKITGSIKGGQGFLLKGEESATVNVTLEDGDATFAAEENLLVGTTAPVYFGEAGLVYGLSGTSFKKNAVGTIKANKAYLPASEIPVGAEVKGFTFVFNDTTTGIQTVDEVSADEAARIFDLTGRRLSKAQKGVNIINGKKVLVK